MTRTPRLLGLVAGEGRLPVLIAEGLRAKKARFSVFALEGAADPAPWAAFDGVTWTPLGQLGRLLDGFRSSGVTDLVLAGRVRNAAVLRPEQFDARLKSLLSKAPDNRGNTLLAALVSCLETEGFQVLSNLEAAPQLTMPKGRLAGPAFGPSQERDVRFAWPLAKQLSRLDIGQTVIVKEGTVVAVEAIEGTNAAIRRAGELVGPGLIAVKVASDAHDFRFDVPTVGPDTAAAIASTGGGVLAVEAGRTFLLDRERVYETCDKGGVALVGVDKGLLEGGR